MKVLFSKPWNIPTDSWLRLKALAVSSLEAQFAVLHGLWTKLLGGNNLEGWNVEIQAKNPIQRERERQICKAIFLSNSNIFGCNIVQIGEKITSARDLICKGEAFYIALFKTANWGLTKRGATQEGWLLWEDPGLGFGSGVGLQLKNCLQECANVPNQKRQKKNTKVGMGWEWHLRLQVMLHLPRQMTTKWRCECGSLVPQTCSRSANFLESEGHEHEALNDVLNCFDWLHFSSH